jgi:hypothetical protein
MNNDTIKQALKDARNAVHDSKTYIALHFLDAAIAQLDAAQVQPEAEQPAAWMLEFADPSENVTTADPREVEMWRTLHDNPYEVTPLYKHPATQPFQEPHPLEGLHINQGSFDAASDAYEADYWQAKFEKAISALCGPFADLTKNMNGNYNDKFAFYAYFGWQMRGNEHSAAPVQPAIQINDAVNMVQPASEPEVVAWMVANGLIRPAKAP